MFDGILRRGDHISIKEKLGLIRHHMLVTEVKIHNNYFELKVIHMKKLFGGCITEEEKLIEKDSLLQHIYDSKYTGDEAIGRARQCMKIYKTLSFNCEHFIRWAKTGESRCLQLQHFGVGAASGVSGAAVGGAAGMYILPS